MQRYINNKGNSGIKGYEIGEDYIIVQFASSSRLYRYSYNIAGRKHVENMKILARKGEGLNTYINKNVHDKYEVLQ